MLSRLFVCAGGSGAVAQLRERFGAAGREGFAQTAREKENKANFSFIPFKEKQNLPPLALLRLKRRLNPCLEKKKPLLPTSYISMFITFSEEATELEAWIYPWPCSPVPAGRGSWSIIFAGSDLIILPVLVGGSGHCKGSL